MRGRSILNMANPIKDARKINLVINARSRQYSPGAIKSFNMFLIRLRLEEYNEVFVKKEMVRIHGHNALYPRRIWPKTGNRTYFFGGVFLSQNPLGPDIPF